jgi:hypothetical protein
MNINFTEKAASHYENNEIPKNSIVYLNFILEKTCDNFGNETNTTIGN